MSPLTVLIPAIMVRLIANLSTVSIDHYSGPASTVFEGLSRATARITGGDIRSDQIAIGEALFWGTTLDELLHKAYRDPYVSARDADALGGCVSGARLARNAIAHGAVIVQSVQGGMTFPMTFPISFGDPAWLPLEKILELASPPKSSWLAAQEASYAAHFAARPSASPLHQLRDWFVAAADAGFTAQHSEPPDLGAPVFGYEIAMLSVGQPGGVEDIAAGAGIAILFVPTGLAILAILALLWAGAGPAILLMRGRRRRGPAAAQSSPPETPR